MFGSAPMQHAASSFIQAPFGQLAGTGCQSRMHSVRKCTEKHLCGAGIAAIVLGPPRRMNERTGAGMSENKTIATNADVMAFLNAVEPERHRLDGLRLNGIFQEVTRFKPVM